MLAVLLSGQATGGTEGKSMGKALLLSLALPGAGQQYLGNHARARTMYVAEAGVWSAFAYFRIQGDNRKDRYKEIAELFAGAEGSRDDDYTDEDDIYTDEGNTANPVPDSANDTVITPQISR